MSYHPSTGSGYRQHRAKQRSLLPAGKRFRRLGARYHVSSAVEKLRKGMDQETLGPLFADDLIQTRKVGKIGCRSGEGPRGGDTFAVTLTKKGVRQLGTLRKKGASEKVAVRIRGGSRQVVASGGRWERPTLVWSKSLKTGREWGLPEYAKYLTAPQGA